MVAQAAAALAAIALTVLVLYLIRTLQRVQRAVEKMYELLRAFSVEATPTLVELRTATQHMNRIAERVERVTATAEDGVEHAADVLRAVGDWSGTIRQAQEFTQDVLDHQGRAVRIHWASVRAGIRAATNMLTHRWHTRRHSNGR